MIHKRILAGLLSAAILLLSGCGAIKSTVSKSSKKTASSGSAENALPDDGIMNVYCFSAGKADAILLYTSSAAVLIDTGEEDFGKEIVQYLEKKGISTLDYLLITHFDKDHVGGAAKILSSVSVKHVLQSDCPKDSDEYDNYVEALSDEGITPVTVRETASFSLDGMSFTVDPPQQTDYDTDASNNSSLITSVTYGERDFLFAGDAEDARMQEFLMADSNSYDFLKVPYHGHWQDLLTDFVTSVKPSYAVITSSEKEPEDDKTVSLLTSVGAQVFLTRNAPVLAECDGTSLTVQYENSNSDGTS